MKTAPRKSAAKRNFFLTLLLSLLFGCADPAGPPLDSTCETKTITLTVQVYPSKVALNDAKQRFEPGSPEVDGFATMYIGTDRHTLHVLSPRGRYDDQGFYLWGHELGHAICGTWHPVGVPR